MGIVNSGSGVANSGGTATITIPITGVAGDAISVHAHVFAADVSGVTYNGVSITAGPAHHVGGQNPSVADYHGIAVVPDGASHDVVVTLSIAAGARAYAFTWSGVASVRGTGSHGAGTGSPANLGALTSAVGELAIASIAADSTTVTMTETSPGANAYGPSGGATGLTVQGQTFAGAVSITPEWTMNESPNWAMAVMILQPSVASDDLAELQTSRQTYDQPVYQ